MARRYPMMPRCHTCLAAKLILLLGWAVLFIPTANAHNTVVYDTVPGFAIGGAGNISGPFSLLAMVTVRLRSQNLEIDLTMADAAAYGLLANDPYNAAVSPPQSSAATTPLASNVSQPEFSDPHFMQDHSLLAQRGVTLLTLTSNGAPLVPLLTTVEMTTSQDVVFHLTYPPVSRGQLHLLLKCFDQSTADKKALINVMDATGHSLSLSSVDANTPAFDFDASPPSVQPATTAISALTVRRGLGVVAGMVVGLAVLWLLFKLRQPPAKD